MTPITNESYVITGATGLPNPGQPPCASYCWYYPTVLQLKYHHNSLTSLKLPIGSNQSGYEMSRKIATHPSFITTPCPIRSAPMQSFGVSGRHGQSYSPELLAGASGSNKRMEEEAEDRDNDAEDGEEDEEEDGEEENDEEDNEEEDQEEEDGGDEEEDEEGDKEEENKEGEDEEEEDEEEEDEGGGGRGEEDKEEQQVGDDDEGDEEEENKEEEDEEEQQGEDDEGKGEDGEEAEEDSDQVKFVSYPTYFLMNTNY